MFITGIILSFISNILSLAIIREIFLCDNLEDVGIHYLFIPVIAIALLGIVLLILSIGWSMAISFSMLPLIVLWKGIEALKIHK